MLTRVKRLSAAETVDLVSSYGRVKTKEAKNGKLIGIKAPAPEC